MAEERYTSQELRDLRSVFDTYNPTGTGEITVKDLKRILRAIGLSCSQQRLVEALKDDSQTVVRENFIVRFENLLDVVEKLQGDDYDLYGEIEQAFSIINTSGSGQMSAADIQTAAKSAGLRLTNVDVEGMIEEADRNGDGLVSQQEFVSVIMKTPLYKNCK